jgi:hypothetical protein
MNSVTCLASIRTFVTVAHLRIDEQLAWCKTLMHEICMLDLMFNIR